VVSGHVESLFSAAYDGELSADARAAFDRHLGECSACAAAFAELTTAVDALREQPTARMPHPVRLPEGSPIPERRWFEVAARLSQGRRLLTGLTAAGLVAAAAVAAVVVVGHLNPGAVVRSSSSASVSGPMALAPAHAPALGVAPTGNASTGTCTSGCALLPEVVVPSASATCASTTLSISATSAAQIPDGFNNRVTQDEGGTDVILAAPSFDYTPGATVDIYARLINDSTDIVSLPCTLLAGPEGGGSGAATEVPATTSSATPAETLTVGGQPVLKVVVPSIATAGETYQIVIDVPASAGDPQAWQASIPIQVT
jgi:predicted anti-sigma-YlaC factor YlaD